MGELLMAIWKRYYEARAAARRTLPSAKPEPRSCQEREIVNERGLAAKTRGARGTLHLDSWPAGCAARRGCPVRSRTRGARALKLSAANRDENRSVCVLGRRASRADEPFDDVDRDADRERG